MRKGPRWIGIHVRHLKSGRWKHPELKFFLTVFIGTFDRLHTDDGTPVLLTIVFRVPRQPWLHVMSDWRRIFA